MNALEELTGLAGNLFNPAVQDWKKEGKKVAGFFCCYVPEEVLYAADILPYRVRAPHCTQTSSADVYLSHFNCSLVRSCLQFAYEGRYDFIDGYVFTSSCDQTRRLYDVMRETMSGLFMHFLSVPHKVSQQSIAYYRDEIIKFKEGVERYFGVEVTEAGLRNAIEVYNETRDLLKRLYELRRGESPPLTGAESLSVLLAGTMIPREQYNQLLRKLLEELKERQGISDYKARLMIAGGGGCDDPAFYQAIEELGGLIVADSLCYGSRYFWEPVEPGDDPWLALARAYLDRPACANMVDKVAQRSEFVRGMVERSKADGVVFQRLRYCDLWGGQLLDMENKLKQWSIPLLSLEREYGMGSLGQLRTRVQAFLETMER